MSRPLIVFVLALGCGPDRADDAQLIDHRIAPCRDYCEIWLDPECGYAGPTFPDVEACADSCATWDGDASYGWGYQGNGEDACVEEWMARSACVQALACDAQHVFWNHDPFVDYACKTEDYAAINCQVEHPYAEDEP